ncbi:alginate lyase family protein [Coraliomargarita sp. SDUM461004]|uniref:Alginate lyase family protein n=1 Tax=Thalassobacterium sedimentorum TaxID=3041258 RepID=A0ABU1AJT0_9BACT|nr:alginate lyase family protein [Coraliomargarita sp. SDUM461004]MDQ8193868.1 alginate lyase family protein [Coraliomargarita sp. SDUM461004]
MILSAQVTYGELPLREELTWVPRPEVFVSGEDMGETMAWLKRGGSDSEAMWEAFVRKVNVAIDESSQPYHGSDLVAFRYAAIGDATAVSDLALYYELTGDETALAVAKQRLMIWAEVDPLPGSTISISHYPPRTDDSNMGVNRGINFAIPAAAFSNAYALLYPYLNETERVEFRDWLLYLVSNVQFCFNLWVNNDFYDHQAFNNHMTTHMLGLAASGAALEDVGLLDFVYRNSNNPRRFECLIEGVILTEAEGSEQLWYKDSSPEVQDGEIYDRYRIISLRNGKGSGLMYSMIQMRTLLLLSELARINKIDGWQHVGHNGESLDLAFNFMAPILLDENPAAQGEYYANDHLLTPVKEATVCYYHLARAHYPESLPISAVLEAFPGYYSDEEFMGFGLALLHQRPLTFTPEEHSENIE